MPRAHYGQTDKDGNFKNKSRGKEGFLVGVDNDKPFPALVTAWYPKSQTIDVLRPIANGNAEYEGVIVYGNFFDEIGTLHIPQIATKKPEIKAGSADTNYTTVRDPNSPEADPTSEKYVLDNHIEALVCKISVGNTFGYAAQSFRFLHPESVLLNNIKSGRKITRHDDGSYFIHDADGNIEYNHPSGFRIRAGTAKTGMDLEIPFPEHEKNKLDYADAITIELKIPSSQGILTFTAEGGSAKIEHPSGSIFDVGSDGKFEMSKDGIDLRKLHDDMNDIVGGIVTNGGVNPNPTALAQLKTDTAKLLK